MIIASHRLVAPSAEQVRHYWLIEFIFLLLLGFAVFYLALTRVYPNYFEPYWPNHSDQYLAAEMFRASDSIWNYFGMARPIGMAILHATGYFGIEGSLIFLVGLVLVNNALTAMLFRRVLHLPLDVGFFCGYAVYAFLAYAHPFFYEFFTHDAMAHFSYAILLLGAWYWRSRTGSWRAGSVSLIGVIALTAFLCKENYGLSACVLAVAIASYDKRARWPAFAVCLGLFLALLYSVLIGSEFFHLGNINAHGDAYQISLRPSVVLPEWYAYLRESFTPLTFGIFAAGVLFMAFGERAKIVSRRAAWIFVVATALLIVPNAMIPNHHFSGYSWTVCYFSFLPILAIFARAKHPSTLTLCVAMVGLAAASPWWYSAEYHKNDWSLQQEHVQKNLLMGLRAFASAGVPGPRRVLVSGVTSVFNPFQRPAALKAEAALRDIDIDVVEYATKHNPVHTDTARFVPATVVRLENYDELWVFSRRGEAITRLLPRDPSLRRYSTLVNGLSARDFLIYPDLLQAVRARNLDQHSVRTGDILFDFGSMLLDYQAWEAAETLLRDSVALAPDNPYVYYSLGRASEGSGHITAAFTWYQQAVQRDTSGNIYFLRSCEVLRGKLQIAPANICQKSVALSLRVTDWGPKNCRVGEVPNLQADGNMAIWMEIPAGQQIAPLSVEFGGSPVLGYSIQPTGIAIVIESRHVTEVGDRSLILRDKLTGKTQFVGTFHVSPRP